jgi:hypothetical protein
VSAASLFIYWQARPDDAAGAEAAASAFQSQVRARHPGLQALLYRRQDADLERVTLMESYACAAGLPYALQAEADAALHAWALSGRHVEIFEAVG